MVSIILCCDSSLGVRQVLFLKQGSLDWSLRHALKYGYVEFFPPAFEFEAIDYDWKNLSDWLRQQDALQWKTRQLRRCLSPKHRYGFRVATQLDPLDLLMYSALVYEIGDELEARRIPPSESIVHSYRFKPGKDGTLYDPQFSYETFLGAASQLADSGDHSFVVVADIADFFPRIYSHRVENALRQATHRTNHAIALERLFAQWNEHYSYGIPVGSASSRLVAEVALDDIDRALLSEGATYLRYSDDFRIFCKSEREAHQRLAFLAYVLFENHGLTLQEFKTTIVPIDKFVARYVGSEERTTINSLSERLYAILREAGITSPYEEIEWGDLTSDQWERIDELNLEEILREQVAAPGLDIQLTRFVLRRLGQLDSTTALPTVLGNLEDLYPVFPDVVRMVKNLRSLDPTQRRDLGDRFLDLIPSDVDSQRVHGGHCLE
jgi:hypothetical protein